MTTKVRIRTNHHVREFKYRSEVPAKVLADQFDYQDDDASDTYFKYLGMWYHTDTFIWTPYDPYWDGAHGECAFSAVMIKLVDDGYIVGRAIW